MPELTADDVAAYTNNRLDSGDDATQRLLDTALDLARRYCGWHVTPAQESVFVMDGPNSDLLVLPTMWLIELTEIVEDDLIVDPINIMASTRGLIRKLNGGWWTAAYSGIGVTMTHGFTEAPAWQAAVLAYVDRVSMTGVNAGARETVGPFTFAAPVVEDCSAFTATEQALLDLYRLEPSP